VINWPNCWGIGSRHFKQSGGFLTWVLIFMSLGSRKKRGYTNLVFKRKTWGFNRFQYSPSLNLGVILSIFRQTHLFCAQSEGQWHADGLCPQRWDGVTATASHSVERWLAFASPWGATPRGVIVVSGLNPAKVSDWAPWGLQRPVEIPAHPNAKCQVCQWQSLGIVFEVLWQCSLKRKTMGNAGVFHWTLGGFGYFAMIVMPRGLARSPTRWFLSSRPSP
jgi:hypothetical protein